MKFGQFEIIRWHPDTTPEQSIKAVMEKIELGDTLGIDEIWVGEHHFSRHGLVSGVFSLLGNVAARTKNARIGTAVVVLPWRSPIQVAEEAATIDILSGGRLTLGVGAGYQALEFDGMGVDLTQARARFREYVDVIARCWQDEPLTFKGDFIDVADLQVLPKPVQKPIPMNIAVSTSPESVDFAASRGLPIMVGGPTAVLGQIPQVIALWHERMEHHGHAHEHIDLGVAQNIYVAPTMEEAQRDIAGLEDEIDAEFLRIGNPKNASGSLPKGYEQWGQRDQDRIHGGEKARELGILPLVGTPEVVAERIERLRELGINSIRGNFGKAGLEQGKMLRCMHMFAEEVMPLFGEARASTPD
ncbi:MAG: LLM class flavin-dependent oxidoreductase [Chromatiales bacterium]|jgi:alkanesulfonate monooxygenase SsuD/methylene tetrahydromethanopterin reductase-like flavin-dependent oxidoreductase (luciferase family)|nr:LLM class flavin-dependent oxidoreductase [Chromatiales bacterium]